MKFCKAVAILLPILLSSSSAYATGECAKFKGFIATQIAEGTWTYKTSPIKDQEWPEKKCQIEVATKLDDTVTLGTYTANGYLGCQAVYQVTETSSGRSYVIKSTPFAVLVSDSGKPLEALFAEVPIDDVRSAMKQEYRPAPFTIKLHNEGVSKLGGDRSCYAEFKPFPSVTTRPPPKQATAENQKPAPATSASIEKAEAEMKLANQFDFVVVNRELDVEALGGIYAFVQHYGRKLRPSTFQTPDNEQGDRRPRM